MLLIKKIIFSVILSYQKTISPFLGRRCRFYPSCSEYAIQTIEKNGIVMGLFYSLCRILRCQPFSKGGYDPIINTPKCNHIHFLKNKKLK